MQCALLSSSERPPCKSRVRSGYEISLKAAPKAVMQWVLGDQAPNQYPSLQGNASFMPLRRTRFVALGVPDAVCS